MITFVATLADNNHFPGIDMVKFGKDISQIQFRKTITNRSLLTQFDMAIELFEQYYIFEEIDGYNRTKKDTCGRRYLFSIQGDFKFVPGSG